MNQITLDDLNVNVPKQLDLLKPNEELKQLYVGNKTLHVTVLRGLLDLYSANTLAEILEGRFVSGSAIDLIQGGTKLSQAQSSLISSLMTYTTTSQKALLSILDRLSEEDGDKEELNMDLLALLNE